MRALWKRPPLDPELEAAIRRYAPFWKAHEKFADAAWRYVNLGRGLTALSMGQAVVNIILTVVSRNFKFCAFSLGFSVGALAIQVLFVKPKSEGVFKREHAMLDREARRRVRRFDERFPERS